MLQTEVPGHSAEIWSWTLWLAVTLKKSEKHQLGVSRKLAAKGFPTQSSQDLTREGSTSTWADDAEQNRKAVDVWRQAFGVLCDCLEKVYKNPCSRVRTCAKFLTKSDMNAYRSPTSWLVAANSDQFWGYSSSEDHVKGIFINLGLLSKDYLGPVAPWHVVSEGSQSLRGDRERVQGPLWSPETRLAAAWAVDSFCFGAWKPVFLVQNRAQNRGFNPKSWFNKCWFRHLSSWIFFKFQSQ